MHRRPPSRLDTQDIILPPKLYQEIKKVAILNNLEEKEVIARCFLLGFVSFDRPLYVLEDGYYKQILYEDPRP